MTAKQDPFELIIKEINKEIIKTTWFNEKRVYEKAITIIRKHRPPVKKGKKK